MNFHWIKSLQTKKRNRELGNQLTSLVVIYCKKTSTIRKSSPNHLDYQKVYNELVENNFPGKSLEQLSGKSIDLNELFPIEHNISSESKKNNNKSYSNYFTIIKNIFNYKK